MFKIIIECGLEGRLWLTYPLFLFLGKLENPMQKLWATKKKEALFYDFGDKSGHIFCQITATFQSLCIDVTILMTKIPRTK